MSSIGNTPYSQTPEGLQEAEIDRGYRGTLAGATEWVRAMMIGGFTELGGVYENDATRRPTRDFTIVSGGFSLAEHLQGRVKRSLFGHMFWKSSHRGGVDIYQIPVEYLKGRDEEEWFPCHTHDTPYSRVARARSVRLEAPYETTVQFHGFAHGVDLVYREDPDARYEESPSGLLIVRPSPKGRIVW